MLRKTALICSAVAVLGAACADDSTTPNNDEIGSAGTEVGESSSDSSSETGTSSTSTDSSDTVTDTSTDSSDTVTDTTTDTTATDTTDTTDTGGQVCTPGATQCADANSYETCDDLGEGWGDPVDCLPTEECAGGQCISLCAAAEAASSSVGCLYYAIDADNHDGYDNLQYAVVVSNVDDQISANVEVQTWNGNAWATQQSQMVMPGSLYQFNLPDKHINLTGVNARGAYRVVSDVPIIAYQFQPVDGVNSFTSDASLLLPVSALDEFYYVVGWGQNSFLRPEIQIVATADDTHVELTTTTATTAGGPIQAHAANQTWQLPPMQEGDVAQIEGSNGFSGTYITSDKPIAVFSSHNCANVPSLQAACCCDHVEEQTYGLQTWGSVYVAARFPPRNGGNPEPTYWQIFASEDNTAVTIEANAAVTGIPALNFMLGAGQMSEFASDGSTAHPGDFLITADKPISVVQYMSSQDAGSAGTGDPAMSQAVPVEQFRPNYVVLVPPNWINDFLVITKPEGATVSLDGMPIPDAMFVPVGPQNDPSPWQVARVPAADGVHTLDSAQNFSVTVVGYDQYDSYAYPGGLNQQIINPQ